MNSEEPSDESQNPNQQVKNDLIFEDITLEPGTLMTVFHCPIETCPKKNYLDAKSVKTHCRRIHSMIDHEGKNPALYLFFFFHFVQTYLEVIVENDKKKI